MKPTIGVAAVASFVAASATLGLLALEGWLEMSLTQSRLDPQSWFSFAGLAWIVSFALGLSGARLKVIGVIGLITWICHGAAYFILVKVASSQVYGSYSRLDGAILGKLAGLGLIAFCAGLAIELARIHMLQTGEIR